MAHPRRIVRGETYLLTRRCYQRTFRLRPCDQTNRIFIYCLAFAAKRTGVRVHAVCVMSNHHHLVVTDVHGLLPDFLRELHRLTAKALNAAHGEWENLWAAEPCNVVRLVTDEDVDEKIAYVIANPVASGLVERPELWPGVVLWGEKHLDVERPDEYFRPDGTCPAKLELRIERPRPLGADDGLRGWDRRVAELVDAKVSAAHRAVREAGRRFLGRGAVLATSVVDRARSREPCFGRIPTFAACDKAVREMLRLVERTFRTKYRQAFERWRVGLRDEVFPSGTWGMVVVHGARAN